MVLHGIQCSLRPAVVALIASARLSILWRGPFHGLPRLRRALSVAGLLTLPLRFLPIAKVPLESHPDHPDNAPLRHRQPRPGPAGRTDVSFCPPDCGCETIFRLGPGHRTSQPYRIYFSTPPESIHSLGNNLLSMPK